jgi:hypothetical protein
MAIKASVRPSGASARLRKRFAGSGRSWQTDLFGATGPISRTRIPAWQELSKDTRGTLTNLMMLLILEHARASGADAGTEANHDL